MNKLKFNRGDKVNKFGELLGVFLGVCTVCLLLALPIGWVMNVYKLTQCDFEPSYRAEIIRTVGIVAPPVGFVVGYMDLGK